MVGLGSKILTAVLQAGSSDWGGVGTIVKAARGAAYLLQSFALSLQVECLFPSTPYFPQCEDTAFTPLPVIFCHLRPSKLTLTRCHTWSRQTGEVYMCSVNCPVGGILL